VSNLEQTDSPPSFDDILDAVRDSKRGRWFLEEFEARIHNRDSATLLKAIARLETRMETLTTGGATPVELGRVRDAIATARKDLLNLGLPALSDEGRLFAGLAELARQALPANDDTKDRIVRSLQLVDEIDRAVDDSKGSRYFVADAGLFEPVPQAQVPEITIAHDNPAPTGAKFIVRKSDAGDFDDEPAPVESPVATALPDTTINHPRIMIIRRKAEDMPEVELNDTAGEVSAA
jgi:hypothetical protein